MKRRVFLKMKPLIEARELFLNRFKDLEFLGAEEVTTPDSLFRITATAVYARLSSPTFHSAAMDGVAVWAEKTHGVTERNPRLLTIGQDAHWINTVHLMPAGANAVIIVEKLHQVDDETLEITSPVHPWQNVRKVGEDIVATELLLPQNHVITPFDLGALIGGGVFQVKVKKQDRMCVSFMVILIII